MVILMKSPNRRNEFFTVQVLAWVKIHSEVETYLDGKVEKLFYQLFFFSIRNLKLTFVSRDWFRVAN